MISLAAGLERWGRLTEDETLYLALRVATFLAALHQRNELHVALVPERVTVDDAGTVILEEGHAHGRPPSAVHRRTLGYSAPEVLLGDEATATTDVYKAGLLVLHMAVGQAPYEKITTVQQLNLIYTEPPFPELPRLSEPLLALLERCIARDPAERCRDGQELLAAVEALVEERFGDEAPPSLAPWMAGRPFPPPPPQSSRGDGRGPGRSSSWGLAVLLLMTCLAIAYLLVNPGDGQPTVAGVQLRFSPQSVTVSGHSKVSPLSFSLSAEGRLVEEGSAALADDGQFSLTLSSLQAEQTYVLSLLDGNREVGKLAFRPPRSRP